MSAGAARPCGVQCCDCLPPGRRGGGEHPAELGGAEECCGGDASGGPYVGRLARADGCCGRAADAKVDRSGVSFCAWKSVCQAVYIPRMYQYTGISGRRDATHHQPLAGQHDLKGPRGHVLLGVLVFVHNINAA